MKQQKSRWWRPLAAGIFIAVAVVAVVGAVVTRYIDRNLLDSDGYLAVAGPLPQEPEVATALAKFTTSKVFDATEAQESIGQLLPPRLAPLAGPLSDILQQRADKASRGFIQSDAFNAIWTGSNSLLQRGVMRLAESKQGEGRLAAAGQLDLTQLVGAVRQRLGGAPAVTPGEQERAAAIQLNLRQRVERLRATYRAVKTGAYVMPYAAVAFLLAALAVAYNRRRAVMAIGAALLLLGVAMILAFKIVSGGILDDVTDPAYKSAAEVIYEAFYSDLRARLAATMAAGATLILLAIIAGPYKWARSLRGRLALAKLKKTEPYRWIVKIRGLAAKYEPWLLAVGTAAAIIWLLLLSTLTPATLVVILSILISYTSLVHLIARPSFGMINRHG